MQKDADTIELTHTDLGIIQQLNTDGRMTTRDLARNLGISEVTARRRLKRLQESDVLKVVAVVSPSRLSYSTHAIINLGVNIKYLEEIGATLIGYPEVRFLAITSGAYDIHMTAALRDADHLLQFLTKKIAPLEGVISTNTVVSLRVLKTAYSWMATEAIDMAP